MKKEAEHKNQSEKDIPIYADGSGSSIEQFKRARDIIKEKKEHIKLVEAFLAKYKYVLSGISFDVGMWSRAEISIFCGGRVHYRQETLTPKEAVVKLFPSTKWERVKEDYSEDYDYEAIIDGVVVRFKGAELSPRKIAAKKPKRTKLIL